VPSFGRVNYTDAVRISADELVADRRTVDELTPNRLAAD
jgi:hypothetical protein